jgi:hypothetical protein
MIDGGVLMTDKAKAILGTIGWMLFVWALWVLLCV